MIASGLAAGAVAALVVMRLIESLLVGIVSADPKTMAGVAGILAAVAFAACYLPARRAATIDPVIALKAE